MFILSAIITEYEIRNINIIKFRPRVFNGFIVIQAFIIIILVFVVTPLKAMIIKLAGLLRGDLNSICFNKCINFKDIHEIKKG